MESVASQRLLISLIFCVVLGGYLYAAWLTACGMSELKDRALDDAFITYVYGRNLAEGHGLRYNAADAEPTEGFTSPLHVLLAALFHALGVDPLFATRSVSYACLVATPFVFTSAIVSILGISRMYAALGALTAHFALLILPEAAFHLVFGLETTIYAALHAWTFAWVARFAANWNLSSRSIIALGILLLLCVTLCRFEGIALAAGYLAVIPLARARHRHAAGGPSFWHRYLAVVLGFVIPAAGFIIWKRAYFGDWFSNPYYVKVHNEIFGSSGVLLPGLGNTRRFILLRYVPLAFLACGLAVLLGLPRRNIARVAVLLLPSLAILALYCRTIHAAAFFFRYEYPYLLPLIGILALVVALLAVQRAAPAAVWLMGTLAVCVPFLTTASDEARIVYWLREPLKSPTDWIHHQFRGGSLANLGRALGTTGLGQKATILLSGAGQVPYFSRFFAIDWLGLNNNRLSGREPLTIDEVWSYIDSYRPDVIYSFLPPATPNIDHAHSDPAFRSPSVQHSLDGRGCELFHFWDRQRVEEMFYREMRYVRDHYEFGAAYALWSDWALIAYVRRDSAHRDEILAALARSARLDHTTDLTQFYVVDPRQHGRSRPESGEALNSQ